MTPLPTFAGPEHALPSAPLPPEVVERLEFVQVTTIHPRGLRREGRLRPVSYRREISYCRMEPDGRITNSRRSQVYTKSHEDRKIEQERAACDAAIRWGAEAETTIEEVLLVAERTLADAGRRLRTELVLPPGSRYDLTSTAGRLSDEVETLRNRLDEDLADLARIERERRVYDRKRADDHAASLAAELPAHLMESGEAMLRAITPAKVEP